MGTKTQAGTPAPASRITRASTTLLKAREVLSNGWCKGTMAACTAAGVKRQYPDRFCAIGSLHEVTGAKWWPHGTTVNTQDIAVNTEGLLMVTVTTSSIEQTKVDRCEEYLDQAVFDLSLGQKSKIHDIANDTVRIYGEATDYEFATGDIALFNDHKRTTKRMVLRAFDLAAELARKDEQRERQRRSRANRRAMAVA